jgi:energy-coupling factor transport system permease protein
VALWRARRHPVAWMLWIACASVAALLTRNPWYLGLIGAGALCVRWRLTRERPGWGTLAFLGSLLIFPALLNLLFSRAGDTVLLWLPIRWIGGPYTLEALLFGLSAGVQIASLLTVMSVFNAAVTAPDLLRRMPPGLYPVGVSASIGLTFAPRARRAFEAVREAQQIRGHQMRGWRDLPGLVTPLVVLGLESALGLAEGMVARGWGRGGPSGWKRLLVAAGWLGLGAGLGLWAVAPRWSALAFVLALASAAALWAGLGRKDGRNRYRPETWHRGDSLVAGLSLGVLAVFVFLAVMMPEMLTYYPYPRATWPGLHPALAATIALLTAPAWTRNGCD